MGVVVQALRREVINRSKIKMRMVEKAEIEKTGKEEKVVRIIGKGLHFEGS